MTTPDKDEVVELHPSEWKSVDAPPPFWGRNAKHFFILLALGLTLHPVIWSIASALIRPLFR
jgi:hypothetical protein